MDELEQDGVLRELPAQPSDQVDAHVESPRECMSMIGPIFMIIVPCPTLNVTY